jgi:hypothetical protein
MKTIKLNQRYIIFIVKHYEMPTNHFKSNAYIRF